VNQESTVLYDSTISRSTVACSWSCTLYDLPFEMFHWLSALSDMQRTNLIDGSNSKSEEPKALREIGWIGSSHGRRIHTCFAVG